MKHILRVAVGAGTLAGLFALCKLNPEAVLGWMFLFLSVAVCYVLGELVISLAKEGLR